MTTITTGTTTITPDLVLGWNTSQESRNIMHTIIGKAEPEVTLKVANLRTGTLELFFKTVTDAEEARTIHATNAVFTLTSTELPAADMKYVVSGSIGSTLEDTTRTNWTVTVDFQEVL